MKGRKDPFPKRAVITIIVLFVFFFSLLSAVSALKNLDYFRIKNIICNGSGPIKLSYLKEKNIFAIDLEKESVYISGLYPAYRKIKVFRVLPDKLYVDFIKRRPLAYVRLYRYFCVDDDLVLFNIPEEEKGQDLPVITGLDSRIFGVTSGKRCNLAELAFALNIIKEARANTGMKSYKIARIDIANANNASFFVSQGLEVKIGADNLKGKMNILSSLLNQANSATASIKYIDLRFKQPVIKLKDAKQ